MLALMDQRHAGAGPTTQGLLGALAEGVRLAEEK